MSSHTVSLKVAHEINIGNVDLELKVNKDGKLLGRLKVSTGGVDWIPSHAQSRYVMTWSEFAEALKKHGEAKPK